MADNFRYIDVVRRPDGTLRKWREYNKLAKYENFCDGSQKTIRPRGIKAGEKQKDFEFERFKYEE